MSQTRLICTGCGNPIYICDCESSELERLRAEVERQTNNAMILQVQVDDLKAELSKHQESKFSPDWSLLQATREAREVTIEKCAEVCDKRALEWQDHWGPDAWERVYEAEDIAAAIRAMKEGEE